jgi:NADH:ubiquinone oxidoreductase subunit D
MKFASRCAFWSRLLSKFPADRSTRRNRRTRFGFRQVKRMVAWNRRRVNSAFYVVSNGKPNPYRYHVRPPSFVNLTAVEKMCKGVKIADFVALLAMLDIVMGEVDRA